MATVSLISRLAHSSIAAHLATLQAQLTLAEPLDFALVTSNGSLLGFVMRLLCASYVGAHTQWGYSSIDMVGRYQSIPSADLATLRSNLLSKLQSFVHGPDSDVSKMLNSWLGQQTAVLHSSVQPLADGVTAALLAKGADPLATDADGNNALFHLVKSGDYAQLIKLLRAEAPWQACGVESGGVKGPAASHSDINKTLHLLIGQQMGAAQWLVHPLTDDVIAALLAKGADPLAPDAKGDNTLFHLAQSGDYARLIKLVSGSAPWSPCGLETAVFHHNAAGQTARSLVEVVPRAADVRVVLDLIEAMETFWTQKIKPTLIHTLSHDCGMAKDAAILCAQYIDGSSSGGSGKGAEAGAESKEADAAAQ